MCQESLALEDVASEGVRARKRRRPSDSSLSPPFKRQYNTSTNRTSSPNHLLSVLRQYGLLEIIVSQITAKDLLALLLTSMELHEAIAPRPASLDNLLGQLSCSGKGVEIRKECHKRYDYSRNCTEYAECGRYKSNIKKKACVGCKVATCNECRVHVVFQSIFEPSSDPEELPEFSGFVLLEPDERRILSPQHLPSDATRHLRHWQDPSSGNVGPYHDQGYLELPFETSYDELPQWIDSVLDFDLGQRPLMCVSSAMDSPVPTQVLKPLCAAAEQRKMRVCSTCLKVDLPMRRESPPSDIQLAPIPSGVSEVSAIESIDSCHCTLRSRFLDRWLCLECYQKEDSSIKASLSMMPIDPNMCACGSKDCHVFCRWCGREVLEFRDDVLSFTQPELGSMKVGHEEDSSAYVNSVD